MATVYNMRGTSYQSFTIGKNGATIHQGTEAPDVGLGRNGDLYVQRDASAQNLWQKISGTWTQLVLSNEHIESISALEPIANGFLGTDASEIVLRSAGQARTAMGLGTVATHDVGVGAGNIPQLDSAGKLLASVIPDIAITSVTVVGTIEERDELDVQTGDVVIVTGTGVTYIYDGLVFHDLGSIGTVQAIKTTDGTKTGVVELDASDILTGTFTLAQGGTGHATIDEGDLLVGGTDGYDIIARGTNGQALMVRDGALAWSQVAAIEVSFTANPNAHLSATTVQGAISQAASTRAYVASAAVDPTAQNDMTQFYKVGDIWVNTVSGEVFVATSVVENTAVWSNLEGVYGVDRLHVVSPTGSNDGVGSFARPYATIAHAVSVAGTGDVIYLLPGDYTADITFSQTNLSLVSPGATIRGATTITGEGFASKGVNFVGTTGVALTVSGVFAENMDIADAEIGVADPADTAVQFITAVGESNMIRNSTIAGRVHVNSTSANVIILANVNGFGLDVTQGAVSVFGALNIGHVTHAAGSLALRNIGTIGKSEADVSVSSTADDSVGNRLVIENASLRQADGTYGTLTVSSAPYVVADLDRGPGAPALPEANRIYGRFASDIGTSFNPVSYSAAGPNVRAHLVGIDEALNEFLTGAIRTFKNLEDVGPIVEEDALKVLRVNGAGTGVEVGVVLGTAAQSNATAFATAAQGAKADTAIQANNLSLVALAANGNFLSLTDVPSSYENQASKILRVNAAGTSVEFAGPLGTTAYTNSYEDLGNLPTLGTASARDTGILAGNVPVLDSNGKLVSSIIPAVAITDVYVVETLAERDLLDVQGGDIAKVTSAGATYIYDGAEWIEFSSNDSVLSVNGEVGAVVLGGADIVAAHTPVNYTVSATHVTAHFAGIDTALGSVLGQIQDLETLTEAHTDSISTLNGQVGTLQTDTGTLRTDVDALETRATDLESDVSLASGQIQDLETELGELTTTVGVNTTAIADTNTALGTLTTTVEALDGSLTTQIGRIDGVVGDLSALSTVVDGKVAKADYTAAGSLIVGSSTAGAPAELLVGTEGQVLTVGELGALIWADGGTGGSMTFAGLSDVNLTSLAIGQYLSFDGTDWINVAPTSLTNTSAVGGVSPVQTTGRVGTELRVRNLYSANDKITVTADNVNQLVTFTFDETKINIANTTGTLGTAHGGTGLTAVGTAGQVLTSNGTTLSWATPAGGSSIATGTTGVYTAAIADTVTIESNDRDVARFHSTSGTTEHLEVETTTNLVTLSAAGPANVGISLKTKGTGALRIEADGPPMIKASTGDDIIIEAGTVSAADGADIIIRATAGDGANSAGGNILLEPGAPGAGGAAGQVVLPSGYLPTAGDSVINKSYVDGRRISNFGAATSNVSMGGFLLTNVGAPISGADVANKTYVDDSRGFRSLTVVTTGTISLTAAQAVVIVNHASDATTTVTLPEGVTNLVGKEYVIKDGKGNAATRNITINAFSGQTIDGASSILVANNYESVTIIWTGTFWSII